MGTYLQFIAKPGCENQINAAYAVAMDDPTEWLVYSEKIIVAEIAYIHSPKGESQAHLRRWLRTTSDWEKCFPTLRRGTGQIKMSGIGDEEVERIAQIKRDIKFILDHRMLFKCIDGFDYARKYGWCDFEADLIEDHRPKRRVLENLLFNDLPSGRCELYRLCVEHGRPDLWKAYHAFKSAPSEETWCELRTKVVPWLGAMTTVWSSAEEWARRRDGQDFGLRGRFRDGNLPSQFQLRAALKPSRATTAA